MKKYGIYEENDGNGVKNPLYMIKNWLPIECVFQNRRFTAYTLACLVIIYFAAKAAAV